MRVVKDATTRKKEILDVAERMFCTNGYDNTSTNDILAEIGIARGTLYYYFTSKEDILDGIIDRIIEEIVRKVSAIAMNEEIPVLERFTAAVLSANVDTEVGDMILEEVHKPQNALMNQKMNQRLLSEITPFFVKIIKDGIAEGMMQSEYPDEVVEMTLFYANATFDDANEYPEEIKIKKVKGFISNVELMLRMEPGSLFQTMIPMFYRK